MGTGETTRWIVDGRWRADAVLGLFARMVPEPSEPIDRFVPRRPRSAEQLRDGTKAFGVVVPVGLAGFVEQVGDGCPGPGYGLWPLGSLDEPDASVRRANLERSLLTIADFGCGMYGHVRVDDSGRGEVWLDDDRGGRSLAAHTFDEWYGAWLDRVAASPDLLGIDDDDATAEHELAEIWRQAIAPSPDAVDVLVRHLAATSGARPAAALRALAGVDPELAHGAARANFGAEDRGLRHAAQDVIRALVTEDDLPLVEAWLLDERYAMAGPPWQDPDRERLFYAVWALADGAGGGGQPGSTAARELMARLSMTTMLGHAARPEELQRFREDMAAWRAGGEPAEYIRDDMQAQLDQVRGALRDHFDQQADQGGPGIPQELRDLLDDD